MNLNKLSPSLVGFLQAIAVGIYCSLVASFFWFTGNNFSQSPEILVATLMLFLLVFSATACATLVFVYPVYLMLQHDIRRALKILAYTLLYAIIVFIVILLTIFYF